MNIKLSIFTLLFISCLSLHAQRKSDLINEINLLKAKLDSTNIELASSKKNGSVNEEKAASFEKQVVDLQNANSTLLKNLNSFAQISSKNSESVNKALASLEEKEKQLSVFTDAISSHDSTAVVVLTNTKQTLGENAKIGVANGTVIISKDLTSLYGSDTNTNITEEAKAWLNKIATVLSANPKTTITIEGLSITGDLNTPILQATSIANILTKDMAIAKDRVNVNAKDGGFKEGVNFKIHPNYEAFYLMAREGIKNGNK
ncbi:hypothetical protein [uncultured Maribacter sp.]|uniref:hypothetical protein n=1 Tax=uncultured Maribacter sp. TaxID=431308 RepID=UPI0026191A8A|nr:hypothetical protein [uncultured Maribacter sp.]